MVVFTCECCRYTARTGLAFQQHCVQAHYRCIKCQKSFYHKQGIMHHLANAHNEKVRCDHCDYMEYPPSHVIRHELLTHKTCSECGKLHGSVADLQKHLFDVHGMDKPPEAAEGAAKESNKIVVVMAKQSEIATKIHEDIAIKEEPVDEDIGPSTSGKEYAEKPDVNFGALVTLENGQTLVLNNKTNKYEKPPETNEDEKQKCNLCDMVLNDKEELQKHLDERRNVLYTCDLCSFKACTLDGLIDHKKVKHPSPKRIVVRIDPPSTKKQRLNDDHDYFDDDEYGSNIGYETQPTEEGGLLKRKCTKCNFSAKYPYDIYLHGINVHKRCTKCNEDFADKKGIMDHLSTVHCERVQCDMCDFQGFPAFQLSIHQTLTHKKCNKCEARFDTTDDLQAHMNQAHGTGISKSHLRNLNCDKCDYRGIHNRDIFVHNVRVHNACVKCNMDNFEKDEILTHLAVVHDEKVKCNSCDFRSFPPERVSKHIRMMHNKCSDCFQQFNTSEELDLHMNTAHKKTMAGLKTPKTKGPAVVKCEYCDYKGPKGSVKMHTSRIHKGDLRYKYFCEFCDFKTYMKTKIVDHMERRQKHDSLSFCDMCDFKSCTWFGLVFHKSRTHGVTKHAKRFKCGYCEKTFTLHNNFNNHVRKQHQGEQGKFACKICDFKTFDKFYLKKHISNHEEKDFPYQRGGRQRSPNSPPLGKSDQEDLIDELDQVGPSKVVKTRRPRVLKNPKERATQGKETPKKVPPIKISGGKVSPLKIKISNGKISKPTPPKTVVAFQSSSSVSQNIKIYNPESDDSDEDDDENDYVGKDPESDPLEEIKREFDFNPEKMITLKVECTADDVDVDVV